MIRLVTARVIRKSNRLIEARRPVAFVVESHHSSGSSDIDFNVDTTVENTSSKTDSASCLAIHLVVLRSTSFETWVSSSLAWSSRLDGTSVTC